MLWLRDSIEVNTDPVGPIMQQVEPLVRLRTREASGPVRLGLWVGDQRVGGWTVPFMPPNATMIISGQRATGITDGIERELGGSFVRGFDGKRAQRVMLEHGVYTLTVDQDPDRVVDVLVDVTMIAVG